MGCDKSKLQENRNQIKIKAWKSSESNSTIAYMGMVKLMRMLDKKRRIMSISTSQSRLKLGLRGSCGEAKSTNLQLNPMIMGRRSSISSVVGWWGLSIGFEQAINGVAKNS